MNHLTSIGLDVHARSISAAAFNPFTGSVETRRFEYSPCDVAAWIAQFERPKAVYESGVTGFDLARSLHGLGVECVVCASSKLQRPPADARKKNDTADAVFLARLLATCNITEVFIPDQETEAAHDLVRAHDDLKQDLTRARQRLGMFLMRHGLVFNEKTPTGAPQGQLDEGPLGMDEEDRVRPRCRQRRLRAVHLGSAASRSPEETARELHRQALAAGQMARSRGCSALSQRHRITDRLRPRGGGAAVLALR